MMLKNDIATFLEKFFTGHLIEDLNVSPHTIASYRDTFRLFLLFLSKTLKRKPSKLTMDAITANRVKAFLSHLEKERKTSARSRNQRLSAIRSFLNFVICDTPQYGSRFQQVILLRGKKYRKKLITSLSWDEVTAILKGPDLSTPLGRRDHAMLLLLMQTGLRLSELIELSRKQVVLQTGAHIRVIGKGNKERCTPLARTTVEVLKAYMRDPDFRAAIYFLPAFAAVRLAPMAYVMFFPSTSIRQKDLSNISREAHHATCASTHDSHGSSEQRSGQKCDWSLAGARVIGNHADVS